MESLPCKLFLSLFKNPPNFGAVPLARITSLTILRFDMSNHSNSWQTSDARLRIADLPQQMADVGGLMGYIVQILRNGKMRLMLPCGGY